MQNPEKLTKAELIERLEKLGVSYPKSALKSVYLDLYNKNLNPPNDFSSEEDEIEVVGFVKSDKYQKTGKVMQNHTNGKGVEDLTDSELTDMLKDRGISVGPLVPTTKRVYVNKLKKMLDKEEEEKKYSDDDKDDKIDIPSVPLTRSAARRRTMLLTRPVAQSTQPAPEPIAEVEPIESDHFSGDFKIEKVESVIMMNTSTNAETIISNSNSPSGVIKRSTHTVSTETTEEVVEDNSKKNEATDGEKKPLKPERRWLPVWVQVLITLCLVAFMYLVVQAMESNPDYLTLPSFSMSDT